MCNFQASFQMGNLMSYIKQHMHLYTLQTPRRSRFHTIFYKKFHSNKIITKYSYIMTSATFSSGNFTIVLHSWHGPTLKKMFFDCAAPKCSHAFKTHTHTHTCEHTKTWTCIIKYTNFIIYMQTQEWKNTLH